jgi:hypothetical protein
MPGYSKKKGSRPANMPKKKKKAAKKKKTTVKSSEY